VGQGPLKGAASDWGSLGPRHLRGFFRNPLKDCLSVWLAEELVLRGVNKAEGGIRQALSAMLLKENRIRLVLEASGMVSRTY
jgi:hypothetical protein